MFNGELRVLVRKIGKEWIWKIDWEGLHQLVQE